MRKEDIVFNVDQLMIVSMATKVADFESYVPVCDLPFTQRSVLPKGAVYEIGVWNKDFTKFRLLRDFANPKDAVFENEKFDIKNFASKFAKFKIKLSPKQIEQGITFDAITKQNKILLRSGLKNYAEELLEGKNK
ncbi:MAG: hypothetical protein IJ975_01780 [Clostridia bacterium]|nr:hypothetical protein [Clostridia bacterium]